MFEFNATFIVAMVSFVVFMFIMNAIFYRPILNIIKKREDYISNNYNEAKKMISQAEKYDNEYNLKLEDAKLKGRDQSAQEIEIIQKSSFAKIQQEKDDAKAKIEEKKEMLSEDKDTLTNEINSTLSTDITSLMTSKILNR